LIRAVSVRHSQLDAHVLRFAESVRSEMIVNEKTANALRLTIPPLCCYGRIG